MRGLPMAAMGVAVAALIAGCDGPTSSKSMTVDGPNQVIFSVPSMTWGTWPAKVAAAIATLPWAEKDSIQADGKSLKVKFAVTDPKQFDEQLVIDTLKKKGYAGAKLASDPPGTKKPEKKDADKPKESEKPKDKEWPDRASRTAALPRGPLS